MSSTLTSGYYPFDLHGPLCPLLDDPQLLFDVYAVSGFRKLIKGFCKKHRWPGKPAVSVSVGEAELKLLLQNLFSSPDARHRLEKVQANAKRKGKEGVPPLHQAIWAWLLEKDEDFSELVKEHCHERGEGLLFLGTDDLDRLCSAMAEKNVDDAKLFLLALTVCAFSMLQPKDRFELAQTLITYFPAMSEKLGVNSKVD